MSDMLANLTPPAWTDIDPGRPLRTSYGLNDGLVYHLPLSLMGEHGYLLDVAGFRLSALAGTWRNDEDWYLDFDGTAGQFIDTGDRLLPDGDFTIFVRFRSGANDGTERVLVGQYANASAGRFTMSINRANGPGQTAIFVGDGAGEVLGGSYALNTPHDFVVVRKGSQWRLYDNGALSNTATNAQGVTQGANTALGRPAPDNGDFGHLVGGLLDARVWHHALSDEEVAALSQDPTWAGLNVMHATTQRQVVHVTGAVTPKKLWMIDLYFDLWSFDGDKWTMVTSTDPPSVWGDWSHSYRAGALYVHEGSLWVRYRNSDVRHLSFARYDGNTGWTDGFSHFITGNNDGSQQHIGSNHISYQGRTMFLLHRSDDPNYNYVITQGPNAYASITGYGIYNDQANLLYNQNNYSYCLSRSGAAQHIEPFEDHLLIGPAGTMPLGLMNNNRWTTLLYRDIYRYRLNLSNYKAILTNLADEMLFDTTLRDAFQCRSSSYWNTFTYEHLLRPVAYKPWRGKVYYITVNWKLMVFDPMTGQRTLVHDFQAESELQVGAGATYTTSSDLTGNGTWTLHCTTNDADAGVAPWYTCMLGAKVTIQNYNGTGQSKVGWINREEGDDYLSLIDENGVKLDGQPSGRQFTVAFGHGYGVYAWGPCSSYPRSFMFIHNDRLHILTCYGSPWSDQTINNRMSPGWLLTVYDGVNPPTMTKIRTPRQEFFYAGVHDEAASLFHVIYVDADRSTMNHVEINLLAGTTREFYDFASATYWPSIPDGALCLWDPGDVTVEITGVTPSVPDGKVTIDYVLFGRNNDLADVMVEYSLRDGQGWHPCTRKVGLGEDTQRLASSTAGTSHTFVHDMTDFGLVGRIDVQYRIRTVRQTRN